MNRFVEIVFQNILCHSNSCLPCGDNIRNPEMDIRLANNFETSWDILSALAADYLGNSVSNYEAMGLSGNFEDEVWNFIDGKWNGKEIDCPEAAVYANLFVKNLKKLERKEMPSITLHHGKAIEEIENLNLPDEIEYVFIEMMVCWKKNSRPPTISNRELELLKKHINFNIIYKDEYDKPHYFEVMVNIPNNKKIQRQFAFLWEIYSNNQGNIYPLKELKKIDKLFG